MENTLEDGLRCLAEAAEQARHIRIELTDEYLERIARVEAMPRNQDGADKSYVWQRQETFKACFKNVRLVDDRRDESSCSTR